TLECCPCCFFAAIPAVTIQLLVTSAALLYGQRRLFGVAATGARKWTRWVTFAIAAVIALVMSALGVFLLVLASNEDFGQRMLANLVSRQNQREVPLDEHRYSAMRKEADARGLDFPIEIVGIKGEDARDEASNGSFDVVILTHVLCSVDSVEDVLANAERALKPGGRYVFMEHVIAEEATLTRYIQQAIAPMLNIVGQCCEFRNLEQAIREYLGNRFDTRIVDFDAPVPSLMRFIRPHIKGVDIKK
ncbi:hypothetical protein ACHAWF_002339, partial [Thalassiosira exigua]